MSKRIKEIGCNLGMAVLAIFVYEFVSQGIVIASAVMLSEAAYDQYSMIIDVFFRTVLIFIFAVWLYRISRKDKHSTERISRPLDLHLLRLVPMITLGLSGLSTVWLFAVELGLKSIPLLGESMQSHNDTWEAVEAYPYIWVFLSVVVAGPIVEELLFRGLVFHHLEKIRGGWFPILVSGIAFGVWHQEPVQCVYTAIMGIGLGIVYEKARDLKIVIFIHMLNNFLSTLPPMLETDTILLGTMSLSVVMIWPTIRVLARMRKEAAPETFVGNASF